MDDQLRSSLPLADSQNTVAVEPRGSFPRHLQMPAFQSQIDWPRIDNAPLARLDDHGVPFQEQAQQSWTSQSEVVGMPMQSQQDQQLPSSHVQEPLPTTAGFDWPVANTDGGFPWLQQCPEQCMVSTLPVTDSLGIASQNLSLDTILELAGAAQQTSGWMQSQTSSWPLMPPPSLPPNVSVPGAYGVDVASPPPVEASVEALPKEPVTVVDADGCELATLQPNTEAVCSSPSASAILLLCADSCAPATSSSAPVEQNAGVVQESQEAQEDDAAKQAAFAEVVSGTEAAPVGSSRRRNASTTVVGEESDLTSTSSGEYDENRKHYRHRQRAGRSVRARRHGRHFRTRALSSRSASGHNSISEIVTRPRLQAMYFSFTTKLCQGDFVLHATRFGLFCAMAWSINSIIISLMRLFKEGSLQGDGAAY
eukprot:TRINITY_DN22294_c2_g1_i1.p1 TRINITY_DN22294_c2_g1~~TRINITY_DN22294_c2_g1_i1.p1  ORF type:complete len:472 (+),score=69.34 TRINITY_DN22294_c2_g1_i1:146-1417(+)